jgi:PAS domain-containing protein
MNDKAEKQPQSIHQPKGTDSTHESTTPVTPIGTAPLADTILHGGRIYQLMVESVRDYAIFMLDPKGHVASWNRGAERIKQYTADEIIGRHFSAFYPPEDLAANKPAM